MVPWKTAGAVLVGAATVLAAGVELTKLDRRYLEILGWAMVACGIVVMLGAVLWLVLRLILPRLVSLLGAQINERLAREIAVPVIDLDDLASRVAERVPVPEGPSPLFPQQVAASVVHELQQHKLVRTPELAETPKKRRQVAHDAMAILAEHLINLEGNKSKLAPLSRGTWEIEKAVLQESPIYDDAVEVTNRAFVLISHLESHTSHMYEAEWVEAARYARDAIDALRAAIKEDA
ncbi:MAG TPA: hypothetical protein VGI69_09975 [Gaiellaceae bacterium]